MPQPLIENHGIDLVNALLVPLALAASVGVLLSIYTGLVASRVFAFFQLRGRAIYWSVEIIGLMHERNQSYGEFALALLLKTAPLSADFTTHGHVAASKTILRISRKVNIEAASICGAEIAKDESVIRDAKAPRDFAVRISNYYKTLEVLKIEMEQMKPNYWAILTPQFFPRYIGATRSKSFFDEIAVRRSDCGDCCENCNKTV